MEQLASGLGCVCDPTERALRAWGWGIYDVPMTSEQREWALNEIGQVEGYNRADHEGDDDRMLARNVMSAWADFCRDKGLL